MDVPYDFKCDKCGSEKYLVAENEYEKVLICDECAECYVVEQKKIRPTLNTPHCPTCGSTNIEKITATSKVVDTVVFGLFGTKRHKSFRCNSCGYEW